MLNWIVKWQCWIDNQYCEKDYLINWDTFNYRIIETYNEREVNYA